MDPTTSPLRTTASALRALDDPLASSLALIAAGDESGLRALYDATSAQVFGLVLGILRDPGLAEDTVIDVFQQVWSQAARYDASRGSVRAWVLMVARSRAIDQLRSRARASGRERELGLASAEPDPRPGPERLSIESERAAWVRSALDSLPPEQRRVIEAAYFQGLSHSEVAAALGQPLGTVKTRIRSGLAGLRQKLYPLEERTS